MAVTTKRNATKIGFASIIVAPGKIQTWTRGHGTKSILAKRHRRAFGIREGCRGNLRRGNWGVIFPLGAYLFSGRGRFQLPSPMSLSRLSVAVTLLDVRPDYFTCDRVVTNCERMTVAWRFLMRLIFDDLKGSQCKMRGRAIEHGGNQFTLGKSLLCDLLNSSYRTRSSNLKQNLESINSII